MSRFHQIIRDPKALADFIDWLPELGLHEKYYVSLFARKKYDDAVSQSGGKSSLRRFLTDKSRLLHKIGELELPLGRYSQDSFEVQEDALALYITPNPRCMRKTGFALAGELIRRLENENQPFNPHSEAMTQAHKSKSRTVFVDFDLDLDVPPEAKESELQRCMEIVRSIVGQSAVTFIETRGGLHCLVEPAKVAPGVGWHQAITRQLDVDQTGDLLLPVPGCCQGGFVPRFRNDERDPA